MAEIPAELSLPTAGLLSFFYAVEPMFKDKDFFFGDPQTCRVIFTEAGRFNQISRRNMPDNLKESARMRSNRISFETGLSVPAPESSFLESLGLGWNGNQEDFEKYWGGFLPGFKNRWEKEWHINRFMGHPDQIQDDMQLSCEIAYRLHTWNDLENSEKRKQIVNSALKWRMLLQIDSEEDKTGIMWGDVGRIYYWILDDDLAELRFDRVICEMQCT